MCYIAYHVNYSQAHVCTLSSGSHCFCCGATATLCFSWRLRTADRVQVGASVLKVCIKARSGQQSFGQQSWIHIANGSAYAHPCKLAGICMVVQGCLSIEQAKLMSENMWCQWFNYLLDGMWIKNTKVQDSSIDISMEIHLDPNLSCKRGEKWNV